MSGAAFFTVRDIPIYQNKVYDDHASALACPRGDVALVQDPGTGLIFNRAFDGRRLVYDASYQNEQALSGAFKVHLDEILALVGRHFEGRSLIEVGCGKGTFLEFLLDHGFNITGIDPAYEGSNPKVIKALFEPGLGICADGIILRHVLEHIPDPLAFLASLAEANGGQGRIYIEVPCFDWICDHRAWFDVFYEHVNYFRLADLQRMFAQVHASGHLFGGQYLYVVAELDSLRRPAFSPAAAVRFPSDFMAAVERLPDELRGRPTAIWGGASKGVLFACHMGALGVTIDQVIDINPAKQGRFMAGNGLKILSPEEALPNLEPGANLLVMNSNYFDEIVASSHNRYNYIRVDQHGF